MAEEFASWLVRKDGGQEVVGQFSVKGVVLYAMAPVKEVNLKRIAGDGVPTT